MSYDNQCSSCGGFCGRGGCKRENVKPEQKPVYQISLANGAAKAAWIDVDEATYYSAKMDATYMARCLYTAPPARKPLTDEQMRECAQAMSAEPLAEGWRELVKFARAIERAHGIGSTGQ